jgi:hypothetical protein
MEFLKSINSLFLGILKRLYYLIPALFTDPFDFLERWFKMIYEPPQWLFWLLLILGFALATILAYHEVRMQKVRLERQLDERQKRKDIRITLGQFLAEGHQITGKCFEKNTEAPVEEADRWTTKVFNYLDTNLGNDYAQRFQSYEGLPIRVTTLSGTQARIEAFIGSRLARLNQFLAELTQLN